MISLLCINLFYFCHWSFLASYIFPVKHNVFYRLLYIGLKKIQKNPQTLFDMVCKNHLDNYKCALDIPGKQIWRGMWSLSDFLHLPLGFFSMLHSWINYKQINIIVITENSMQLRALFFNMLNVKINRAFQCTPSF